MDYSAVEYPSRTYPDDRPMRPADAGFPYPSQQQLPFSATGFPVTGSAGVSGEVGMAYHPNAIDSLKTSPDSIIPPGNYNCLMQQQQTDFQGQPDTKRGRYAMGNGPTSSQTIVEQGQRPRGELSFQDLRAIQSEPMNFAAAGRQLTRRSYDYFQGPYLLNDTRGDLMDDPRMPEFLQFSPSPSAESGIMQLTAISLEKKQEPTQRQMRRSNRLLRFQIQQQQQAQPPFSSSQKFYDDVATTQAVEDLTPSQHRLTVSSPTEAVNAAAAAAVWDQMTRQQQQLRTNQRWRISTADQRDKPRGQMVGGRMMRRGGGGGGGGALVDATATATLLKESLTTPAPSPVGCSKALEYSLSQLRRPGLHNLRPRKLCSPRADDYAIENRDNGLQRASSDYLNPDEFVLFTEAFSDSCKSARLTLVTQPELQHRARYLTEGSRGPIKSRNLDGYPTIQLQGWSGPAMVQVYVANETADPRRHMFYQVCLVSAKTNRGCSEEVFGYTTVVHMPFVPNTEDRTMIIDSVGIVKLRNADVERRIASLPEEHEVKPNSPPARISDVLTATSTTNGRPERRGRPVSNLSVPERSLANQEGDNSPQKCQKSRSARLVYRVLLLNQENKVEGVLQVISDPIRCTQVVGGPEICRMSIQEAAFDAQPEIFIIGKNFIRGSRVFFRQCRDSSPHNDTSSSVASLDNPTKVDVVWEREAVIDATYFYQTHLICTVPKYDGPTGPLSGPVQAQVYIKTPTNMGRPESFTFLPPTSFGSPPALTRLSIREATYNGDGELIILGQNISTDTRVIFRQLNNSITFTGSSAYKDAIVWQCEANVDVSTLNEHHLICRIPQYNGPSRRLVLQLPVQVLLENSEGSSAPETFYYITEEI